MARQHDQPTATLGAIILQWMADQDRSPGYLATKSGIGVDRLIDLISGAAAITLLEAPILAKATGFTEEQILDAGTSVDLAETQSSAPDPLQCLKVKDVAALLQVSEDTVREAIGTGSIPSFVVGQRNVRIPRMALEQHLVQAGGAA